jgi:hypothetical protein
VRVSAIFLPSFLVTVHSLLSVLVSVSTSVGVLLALYDGKITWTTAVSQRGSPGDQEPYSSSRTPPLNSISIKTALPPAPPLDPAVRQLLLAHRKVLELDRVVPLEPRLQVVERFRLVPRRDVQRGAERHRSHLARRQHPQRRRECPQVLAAMRNVVIPYSVASSERATPTFERPAARPHEGLNILSDPNPVSLCPWRRRNGPRNRHLLFRTTCLDC